MGSGSGLHLLVLPCRRGKQTHGRARRRPLPLRRQLLAQRLDLARLVPIRPLGRALDLRLSDIEIGMGVRWAAKARARPMGAGGGGGA